MKNLSKIEKFWILYDIANSAFILLATTVIPLVFNAVAGSYLDSTTYLAYWGYAVSLATILTAVLGPILGNLSDSKGKMPFFKAFLALGILGLIALALAKDYRVFLALFVASRLGYNGANIFYDSMLVDVSPMENRDLVSSYGFAWGYIGSVIPFVISIGLILMADTLGIGASTATLLAFALTGAWWFIFSLPLIKSYGHVKKINHSPAGFDLGDLARDIKEVFANKAVLIFLIAFFFYIDGVSTIINMATAYGASLGLSQTGLILALLMTQVVAFPATLVFGKLSKKLAPSRLLNICILAYCFIVGLAIMMDKLWQFWLLAFLVGLFQGGIQSLSRSHFSKIIPQDKSGSYFGIYDIFGKGASIFGTLSVSFLSQVTGNQKLGISILILFFVLGLGVYNYSLKFQEKVG